MKHISSSPPLLYKYVQFYKFFPNIFHAVSGKSILLTWTHYRTLLRVTDQQARDWYLQAIYLTYLSSVEQLKQEIEQQNQVCSKKWNIILSNRYL